MNGSSVESASEDGRGLCRSSSCGKLKKELRGFSSREGEGWNGGLRSTREVRWIAFR